MKACFYNFFQLIKFMELKKNQIQEYSLELSPIHFDLSEERIYIVPPWGSGLSIFYYSEVGRHV